LYQIVVHSKHECFLWQKMSLLFSSLFSFCLGSVFCVLALGWVVRVTVRQCVRGYGLGFRV
jgi:hypothetical protein